MGYIRGLVHGAVLGAAVGVCLAPQAGKKTREQLSSFSNSAKDGYQATERAVRKVTPMVAPLIAKVRHVSDEDEAVDIDARVHIHDHTNGHR